MEWKTKSDQSHLKLVECQPFINREEDITACSPASYGVTLHCRGQSTTSTYDRTGWSEKKSQLLCDFLKESE